MMIRVPHKSHIARLTTGNALIPTPTPTPMPSPKSSSWYEEYGVWSAMIVVAIIAELLSLF
jgi:hypothetical protein